MKQNNNHVVAELESILERFDLVEQVLLGKIRSGNLDLNPNTKAGIVSVLDHAAFKLSLFADIEYLTESK